jgi:hypothetical protein
VLRKRRKYQYETQDYLEHSNTIVGHSEQNVMHI